MSKKDDKPKRKPTGDYEVGFARPPASSQFEKGQSGNRKGRPRKKKDNALDKEEFRKVFFETMSAEVPVRMNGRETKMPAVTALLHRTLQKALSGDYRSMKLLFDKIDGNMKIEDVMREAEANLLPNKIIVEFVDSDGEGGLKKYNPKAKETLLDEGDKCEEGEDAWLK